MKYELNMKYNTINYYWPFESYSRDFTKSYINHWKCIAKSYLESGQIYSETKMSKLELVIEAKIT